MKNPDVWIVLQFEYDWSVYLNLISEYINSRQSYKEGIT